MLGSQCVQLFLARAPTQSPDFTDSVWETKIIALISSLASPELRVTSCLDFIHSINMPWSSAVTSLVTECLALDTPHTSQLEKLYSLLQMKAMLHDRYGVQDFNYNDMTAGQVGPPPFISW